MNYKLIRFSKLIIFMTILYFILLKSLNLEYHELFRTFTLISILYIIFDEYYPTINPEFL